MYSTCIFCNGPLGANEVVEHFPVGRRLAFDAAKGRLWVVCPQCARWNLTPLEERWEAIEECEKSFRDVRLRAQTDQIGMARLREGLELIRIGKPMRPEFAAWRYGDMFGARLRHRLAVAGVGVAAGGTAITIGAVAGIPMDALFAAAPMVAGVIGAGFNAVWGWRQTFSTTHVPREHGGRPYSVLRVNIAETHLVTSPDAQGWALHFRHLTAFERLSGDAARRALAILLARVNGSGARIGATREATERIERAGGPDSYVAKLAKISESWSADYAERRRRARRTGFSGESNNRNIVGLPTDHGALPNLLRVDRLALEMSVHEEEERRAMEGELALLEAAWRNAEEIAAIADDLLVPDGSRRFIVRHRKSRKVGA